MPADQQTTTEVPAPTAQSPQAAASPDNAQASPGSHPREVQHLLKLRVPLIVQLARRMVQIGDIRKLSLGAILEFERNVDDPLDLQINNCVIGKAEVVKVGEKFGVRIRTITDPRTRIRSLGR